MVRRLLAVLAAVAAVLLTACAHPDRPRDGEPASWSGRLSLQVQSEPAQSFSAGFELRGAADRGQLLLSSPLGSTLARLQWDGDAAQWQSAGQATRRFASLDALTTQLIGTAVPIGALFEWLEGRPLAVPGWQVDLSQLAATGRLQARRLSPLPLAELRVVLDH
jgi:outer membrane lipoprotein LolB